jgi:hypothetical protein
MSHTLQRLELTGSEGVLTFFNQGHNWDFKNFVAIDHFEQPSFNPGWAKHDPYSPLNKG